MSIDQYIDPGYKSKRSPALVWLVSNLDYAMIHTFYSFSIDNQARLKEFRGKDAPIVLLPNHQLYMDIMVEDLVLRRCLGKHGYYLMRDSLSPWFKKLGGIGILRQKELTGLSREEKRDIGISVRNAAQKEMLHLLSQYEPLVVHSQGTRNYRGQMSINLPNLTNLVQLQEKLGQPIHFVPLEITYSAEKNWKGIFPYPFSKIGVEIKQPITIPDKGYRLLADHIRKEFGIS